MAGKGMRYYFSVYSKNFSYTGKGTEINAFCNTKPVSTKGKKSRDF